MYVDRVHTVQTSLPSFRSPTYTPHTLSASSLVLSFSGGWHRCVSHQLSSRRAHLCNSWWTSSKDIITHRSFFVARELWTLKWSIKNLFVAKLQSNLPLLCTIPSSLTSPTPSPLLSLFLLRCSSSAPKTSSVWMLLSSTFRWVWPRSSGCGLVRVGVTTTHSGVSVN